MAIDESNPSGVPQNLYLPPRHKIRQEGDFYIHRITITAYNGASYDLQLLRVQLSIHEDIFNNAISGTLVLLDASDVAQFLPIIGEELLEVEFTRPDESGEDLLKESYVHKFHVYKMSNRMPDQQHDNTQMYVLHFVSNEYVKQTTQKVSKGYKGMLYSDIVNNLFEDYVKIEKNIEISPTAYPQDYVVSRFTPYEALQQIVMKSISDDGHSGYLYFETMDAFHFKPIAHLLEQEPVRRYNYQPANIYKYAKPTDALDRDIEDDIYRVESFQYTSAHDLLRSVSEGMYGSHLLTVDTTRQIFEEYDFDLESEFDSFKHLHDARPFVAPPVMKPDNLWRVVSTNKDHDIIPWIAGREPGICPFHIEEWILHRYSQLQQINQNKLRISVSGDPRRHAGQVIEFYPPNSYGSFDKDHPQDPPHDRYMSGKWLIITCRHRIENNKYYNEMEIMKDSLFEKIEHVDPIKQQDWTW